MPRRVSPDTLVKLQQNPSNVRNVSIVAHVDHGKTTLADCLISSNGIISSRSITDQMRYLDSREDEQLRGITMKSSAISLHHVTPDGADNLINLIDSPGHIDFSSEVSTAVRLSDGCLVVVDVVEGVCAQTKAVLRQAWLERLKPVLVLNKIDRLIVEKKMSKIEAYLRLQQVLEQVNAAVALLFSSEVMKANASDRDRKSQEEKTNEGKENVYTDWSSGIEDIDDSKLYFAPEFGNVVFASAYHGWAFTLDFFAKTYSKKFNCSEKRLRRALWGDYYINMKQKRFEIGATDKGKEPLFCKMILTYFYEIYERVHDKNKEKVLEFAKQLKVKLYPRDEKSIMTNPDSFLTTLLGQWIPVSNAVLNAVIEHIPNPKSLDPDRISQLLRTKESQVENEIRSAFSNCDPDSPLNACFISKMISVPKCELPQNRRGPLTMEEIRARRAKAEEAAREKNDENTNLDQSEAQEQSDQSDHVFIAISRIFSGTLKTGDKIFALGAKHVIGEEKFVEEITIGTMYLLMGRDLVQTENAPAGSLVGIGGIRESCSTIINTGTLANTINCPPFSPAYMDTVPILRVAVQPSELSQMEKLREGLRLLNIADPVVEILDSATGEVVIGACGEMHLEKCVDDLEKFYAKIKVVRSEPIVPFRETLILPPKVDELGENFGEQQKKFMEQFKEEQDDGENSDEARMILDEEKCICSLWTPNRQSQVVIQAFPLPKTVREFLTENSEKLGRLDKLDEKDVSKIRSKLMETFHKASFPQSSMTVDQIIAFGPSGNGPNIILNAVDEYSERSNIWSAKSKNLRNFDQQLLSGFQVATSSSPMMEEPMAGVGFRILNWTILSEQENFDVTLTSGMLISTVKEACRKAFSVGHKRLLAAMYTCDIQASMDVLGKVYSVISKREGQVIEEDMVEGADVFNIKATIPVIESFGFASEIRGKTSGLASPQLRFSHWKMIEGDPWWIPTTEEEIQHYGEKADYESTSRKYMNMIRKRKGLWVEQKTVEHAEKQRTITRNK